MAEDVRPPVCIWEVSLFSSRLLEYEVWTRINARGLAQDLGDSVSLALARIALIELAPPVLERVLRPFPSPVRTLDAIHLASLSFLLGRGIKVELASYDARMNEAAVALGFPLFSLS